MTQRVVVLGGTGFVGRALAARAAQLPGLSLVVPTRELRHGQALRLLPGVQLVRANLHSDTELRRVLEGADAVVNLVAQLHGSEASFQQVHVALVRRLASACRAADVRRLVHVSALGVSQDAPSRYLRSKARGEAALAEPGLLVTVLRPSVIFGAEDRFLNLFAQLQACLPVMALGGAEARFQPVWVGDVAQALLNCLQQAGTAGQTYEVAGPEVASLAELVRLAGQRSGHVRPVWSLPGALAWLQALALELLPGGPLMSRDNLASMRVPNVASGTLPGLADLGITPTSLAQAQLLEGQRQAQGADLDRWRARHGGA